MNFTETRLSGAYIVEPDIFEDERGVFVLSWSQPEFERRQLDSLFVQCNSAFNLRRGTLRGMHFQTPPFEQSKVVRCARGSIFDAIVDLRLESPTFKQWVGYELSEANRLMLYVPVGFAHGYLTLEDETEVLYQVSEMYAPENGSGVRWDDPAFNISWPEAVVCINERDRTYPDFKQ